jgi:hypothetical protein
MREEMEIQEIQEILATQGMMVVQEEMEVQEIQEPTMQILQVGQHLPEIQEI